MFPYHHSFVQSFSLEKIWLHIAGYLSDDFKSSLQGFAAGLMLSISFLDLAHNAINSIGFLKANLWVSTSVHLVLQWFCHSNNMFFFFHTESNIVF